MNSASTDRPVKMSVRSVEASHGSAVVDQSEADRRQAMAEQVDTRSVNCTIHSVASA
jgi:hypothetical protein